MSIFAGIYYYDSRQQVEEELSSKLKNTISRSPENEILEFCWPGVYIVHADIGAFGHKSYTRSSDDGALIIAGQLLIDKALSSNRLPEIVQLASSLSMQTIAHLCDSRGSFCLVKYSPREHCLLLAVDRLGVRPLYYYDDGKRIIFSTALRIIEGLTANIHMNVDLQSITEMNTLGFPLGNRTPFKEVHCFRGGEARSWTKGINKEQIYWRWDEVTDCTGAGQDAAKELHQIFIDAVRIRNGSDHSARAFLSGGLDSRCIVSALKSLDVETHTYNISWEGSYDEIIGAAYSKRIGTIHHTDTLPENKAGWAWPQIIAKLLSEKSSVSSEKSMERPRVILSGDGGSVGMGRVYMNESIIKALRAGDIPSTVSQIMTYNRIVLCGGTLHPKLKEQLDKSLFQSMCEELSRFKCKDLGKALFLFYLENDQRRHMSSVYENIDLNRVEYLMPFFDGNFLVACTALPLDATLYHHFYVKEWLRTFGEPILEVPWQAYPGHEPCPLPLSEAGVYQWGRKSPDATTKNRWSQLFTALKWAFCRTLPTNIFSRIRLIAVGIAAVITGKNYTYNFDSLKKYIYYIKLCNVSKL